MFPWTWSICVPAISRSAFIVRWRSERQGSNADFQSAVSPIFNRLTPEPRRDARTFACGPANKNYTLPASGFPDTNHLSTGIRGTGPAMLDLAQNGYNGKPPGVPRRLSPSTKSHALAAPKSDEGPATL